jgi:Cu(I)/Ag(I) efflux system membrane fusion protein
MLIDAPFLNGRWDRRPLTKDPNLMENLRGPQWARNLIRRHWGKLLLCQAIVLFGFGYLVASNLTGTVAEKPSPTGSAPAPRAAAAPTAWTCSMHPQIRKNGPGKCPLCSMPLVPVSSTSGGLRALTVSPESRALMNIETTPVERRFVAHEIEMVGKVDFDETRLGYITAWVNGRLDRLFVNFTGVEIKKGDHTALIYSEELYAAQEELLQALRYARSPVARQAPGETSIDLAESAREKLRNWGLTEAQINEIQQRGTPSYHMTLYAPLGGIVIEKLRQEGDRVRVGDRIYTIADLTEVWVHLDAYESDLMWLRYGQEVVFTTEAYPGERFVGRIAFIQPVLDDKTRTVKMRVNVPNAEGRLKPGMFVRGIVHAKIASGGRVMDPKLAGKWICPMHPAVVKDKPGPCDICDMPLVRAETLGYVAADADEKSKPLVIPVSAPLITGKRAVVYVEVPKTKTPTFEGREIVLGPRAGDNYIVRSGLAEGELVVSRGNFKIDSELQIQAKPSMMTPGGGGGGGGHDHGGHAGAEKMTGVQAAHTASLPPKFARQVWLLEAAYEDTRKAVAGGVLTDIRAAFDQFGKALNGVDGSALSGHPLMVWNDLAMLLNNDVVEGRTVPQPKDAQRVYQLLQTHINRLRNQFAVDPTPPAPQRLQVPKEFQSQLGKLWQAYLPVQQALAADQLDQARQALARLQAAASAVDGQVLAEKKARRAWSKEQANLATVLQTLQQASDITAMRASFSQLSDELGVLINTFGVGNVGPVYRLHCPMAFEGRGAIWFQDNDQTRNPYYGATMLKCADEVEEIKGIHD